MPMPYSLPLALDIGQTLGLIVVILYTIAQLISNKEPKPKVERPRRPRPEPGNKPPQNQPAGGPGNKPATIEETLRREVDEFLRRAQGKPPEEQPEPTPTLIERKPQRPRPTSARPNLPPTPPRRLEPQAKPLRETTVSDHVSQHIGSSSSAIAEHTSHLGEEVALADDRLEEHLRGKFDHQLGNLRRQDADVVAEVATASLAEEIYDLLRSPAGVRQLIIANEILRRPEL